MTGLSSAGEAAVLTPLTTTAYVSLHTADPGNAGASEVSGGGYARQAATFANAGSNPTVAANSAVIVYSPSANWGTVSYFGLWSAVTGGVFRGSGALNPAKTVSSGDTVRFLVNALTITVN